MSEVFRSYLNTVRRDFANQPLTLESVGKDPYVFFEKWFDDAVGAEVPDPMAMSLATASATGEPGVCVVYLRDISDKGLVFFTNYLSRKGKHLEENNQVSANFFWVELDRQIRFTGVAQKTQPAVSDAYFSKRPRPSQLGAWASEQSQQIKSREVLENRYRQFEKQFEGGEVSRPKHWGGYLMMPHTIEFWQGRPNRLHDRIVFKKDENGWNKFRLAP
jgi:pyridoxamine 5'-phosphate oxidase